MSVIYGGRDCDRDGDRTFFLSVIEMRRACLFTSSSFPQVRLFASMLCLQMMLRAFFLLPLCPLEYSPDLTLNVPIVLCRILL